MGVRRSDSSGNVFSMSAHVEMSPKEFSNIPPAHQRPQGP